MSDLRFKILDDVSEELHEAICRGLREHNQARNPVFWAARELQENAARPLNIVAFDSAERVIGGLLAQTQFSWLKIEILSVHKDSQRQGIGTSLMKAAEAEAIARHCKYAFTDTMDYQAPDFYRKRGYNVAGRIEDWDSHGHAKYFLVKRLARV